jgi:hypothetical protein
MGGLAPGLIRSVKMGCLLRIVTSKQHSKTYVDETQCTVNIFIHKHPIFTLSSLLHGLKSFWKLPFHESRRLVYVIHTFLARRERERKDNGQNFFRRDCIRKFSYHEIFCSFVSGNSSINIFAFPFMFHMLCSSRL